MRRGNRSNFGVLLLLMQLMQVGFDRIPPITLGIIGLNTSIYLGILHTFLNTQLPYLHQVCINIPTVWNGHEYSRLIYAAFFHASDMHLYFNMASFLWKGISLERQIGSKKFLYMISVFTALTSITTLYLNYIFATILNSPSYYTDCAVGFSGVIFALKVVTTYNQPPGTAYLLGFIPVFSRYACWAELFLISIMVPNASFTGHLAGILIGLAYVKGPLKHIMDIFWDVTFNNRIGASMSEQFRNRNRVPSYTYSQSRTGYSNDSAFNHYSNGLSEEEQLRRATEESLQDSYPPRANIYPDLSTPTAPPAPPEPGWNIPEPDQDELRQRRLNRFGH